MPHAHYRIDASFSPGVLSRVIKPFQVRNVELDKVEASRVNDEQQNILLETASLSEHEASIVAAKISQIPYVSKIEFNVT